jgi:hypothetical protein
VPFFENNEHAGHAQNSLKSAGAITVQAREQKVDPIVSENNRDKTEDCQPCNACASPASGVTGVQSNGVKKPGDK